MQPTQFVAYYRVSTSKQGAEGLGIEAQKRAVHEFAQGRVIAEFTEVESGGKNDRPELTAALALAKANKATLLIAKMDRLSRNSALVNNLLEANVEFIAVDQPHATPLTIRILAAVAQEEREQISKRVKAALAVAKSRGVKLGGKQPSTITRITQSDNYALRLIQIVYDDGFKSYNGIAAELNRRAIWTLKGAKWSAMQIKRIMDRNC